MKKLISITFLLAWLVSGCSQEEIVKNGQPLKLPKVTAAFDQNESRTYIEDGNLLRWNENDQISFFYKSTLNLQYQFDGETGDNAGTFSPVSQVVGTGNDLACNYAVYPYASGVKITEGGAITATLPSEQSYAVNSFGLGDNTMVAVTKDTDDTFLKFKNVGGYLKLQLYGEGVTVKSITLTGNNNEKLAGTATITSTYDGEPTVSMASDAIESITLDCGEEGVELGASAETATAFWLVVPPTTFTNGFTITVTDVDGAEFIKSTSKNVVIERNVVQPMAAFEVVIEKKPLVKSIHVSTAGELYKQISDSEKYNITFLKISGELNGTDIRLIREMAGRDVNNNETLGTLANLDLSEASIVEGGEWYYCNYDEGVNPCYTSNNIIGDKMFDECVNLNKIILPNNVTSIGFAAFADCDAMESVVIGNNVVSIGSFAFYHCDALMSIDIPDNVVSIKGYAFGDCDAMKSVVIGNGVTSIGNYAFSYCDVLQSVIIGNSVATIGNGAFENCDALLSIDIPNSVTSIGDYTFGGCDVLQSVIIGNGVISIGYGAFMDCRSLTSIDIPDNVTSIGDNVFSDCDAMKSVVIGNGVTSISCAVFYDCDSLQSVTIGSRITSIGDLAFWLCDVMKEFYSFTITPPKIDEGSITFSYYDENTILYVPKGSIEQYKSTRWGVFFKTIKEID